MSFPTFRLAFALGCLVAACSPNKPPTPPEDSGGMMCTTEARLCPDGTGVGRTGPNCEFAPCPTGAASEGDDASGPAAPGTEVAPSP